METTPITPAIRTAKVRSAKTAVPKSSSTTARPATGKPAAAARNSKAPPKKTAEPITTDLTLMIATAAYYLAEQRQFAPGYELQDWLTAEQQILGRPGDN